MTSHDSPVDTEDRVTPIPGALPSTLRMRSGIYPMVVLQPGGDEPAPLSQRDAVRGIKGMKALAHRSKVLSMQEVVALACAFMSATLDLACVVVVHEHASAPIGWRAPHVDDAALEGATRAAERAYDRMMRASPNDPGALSTDDRTPDPRALVLPLSVPLLGVIRFEGEGLDTEGVSAFLRQAIILLSLALARCVDGADSPEDRGAPPEPAPPRPAEPHEVFATALTAARTLERSLDGTPGACRYAADAMRLARAMTLNVIDVLELHAKPAA